MPIVDYEYKADQAEKFFFSLDSISDKNKLVVRKFLKQYDVSPARKAIFFKHIRFYLEACPDIEKDMQNRDLINDVTARLRKDLTKNYFATAINVTLRLVRWLNDREKPKGFRDVQNVSKKAQRRSLSPKDMLRWADGLKLADYTTSMQLRAAVLTQLDCGFRPSEFVDLCYGDVIVKKDIVVFNVRAGKTGGRQVPAHRCVPHFLRWFHAHPTKQKDHPLWIMESAEKSSSKRKKAALAITDKGFEIRPYEYAALKTRIQRLAKRAELDKPVDFYSLRHSSCYLDKIENVPIDLAAERHGHSTSHFVNVYGRLDIDDRVNRMRKHYGKEEQKAKPVQNVICQSCDWVNTPTANYCFKCARPLTLKTALQSEETKDLLNTIMAQKLQNPDQSFDEICRNIIEAGQ